MKLKTLEKRLVSELDDYRDDFDDFDSALANMTEAVDAMIMRMKEGDMWKLFAGDWKVLSLYEENALELINKHNFTMFRFMRIILFEYLEHEVGFPWIEANGFEE